jgi:hypothetical protein
MGKIKNFQSKGKKITEMLSVSSSVVIRIRKDPKLYAGSGTRSFGSGSGSEYETAYKY